MDRIDILKENQDLKKALEKACGKISKMCKDSNKCNGLYCPNDRTHCMYQCENAESWKEWCMDDE